MSPNGNMYEAAGRHHLWNDHERTCATPVLRWTCSGVVQLGVRVPHEHWAADVFTDVYEGVFQVVGSDCMHRNIPEQRGSPGLISMTMDVVDWDHAGVVPETT